MLESNYSISAQFVRPVNMSGKCNMKDYRKSSAATISAFDFKTSRSLLNGFASKVKNTLKGKRDSTVPSRTRSTCTLNETQYDGHQFKTGDYRLPRGYGRRGSCKFIGGNKINEEQTPFTSDYSSQCTSSSDSSSEVSPCKQTPMKPPRRRRRARHNDDNSEKLKEEKHKASKINLAILGAEGVGKSAFAVRYLTKRYIGEYVPETESIYDHVTNVSGKEINLTLWETTIPENIQQNSTRTCGNVEPKRIPSASSLSISSSSSSDGEFTHSTQPRKSTKTSLPPCSCECIQKIDDRVNWADGVMVLYDIGDQQSFEQAKDLIEYIRRREQCGFAKRDSGIYSSNSSNAGSLPRSSNNAKYQPVPIILIGNKSDLLYRRKIESSLTSSVALSNACSFIEVSVSDSFMPIYNVVTGFVNTLPKVKSRSNFRNMVKSSRR